MLALASPLAAQQTREQFWPEVDVYWRLSPAARLVFAAFATDEAGADRFQDVTFAAAFEVGLAPPLRSRRHPTLLESYDADRLRFLRARVGVRRTVAWSGDDALDIVEERAIGELTARAFLPFDVIAALRNRYDARWLEGDYSWRYRARLWLEREFHTRRLTFIPYAMAEAFYDSRFETWARTRYQAGTSVAVTRWLVPEVYYARDLDTEPSDVTTNALGLVVALYF